MKIAGLIILIGGLLVSVYTGFLYIARERAVGIGDPGMTINDQSIYWQPYLGIGVMVVGGACFMLGRNKKLTR